VAERSAKPFRKQGSRVWTSECRPAFLRFPSKKILERAKVDVFYILPISLYIDTFYHCTSWSLYSSSITKSTVAQSKVGLSKELRLTFISSSGDSFFMSNTREDWSELAVAAGGVGLVPMTTRIRLFCSPPHSDYCQPQEPQGYHWLLLGQPLFWLIITLTHTKTPWPEHSHQKSVQIQLRSRENCQRDCFISV